MGVVGEHCQRTLTAETIETRRVEGRGGRAWSIAARWSEVLRASETSGEASWGTTPRSALPVPPRDDVSEKLDWYESAVCTTRALAIRALRVK